jgi:hypothetical protein
MSGHQEVSFTLNLGRRNRENGRLPPKGRTKAFDASIPRIARLVGLAIRIEGFIRDKAIRDYAEAARLGWVTRARMTQIMQLLNLAPDIQEQILFLPPLAGLNERYLRPIAQEIDWKEQRRLFRKITDAASASREDCGSAR